METFGWQLLGWISPKPAENRKEPKGQTGSRPLGTGSRLLPGIPKRSFGNSPNLGDDLIDRAVGHEASAAVSAPKEPHYGYGVAALNVYRRTAVSAQ